MMEKRQLAGDALLGVAIGFALSGLFYLAWGAFQLLGFFLWSVVAGGGGALLGRLVTGRLWGVLLGAVVLRIAIFVFFGQSQM